MEKLTLEEFYEKAEKSNYSTFIVEMILKYDYEPDFGSCTLIYEKIDSEENIWEWNTDWDEGEDEVWIIGAAALDKIDVVGRFDI